MKKLMYFAAICIALACCSKNDTTTKDDPTEKVRTVLNGHFKSQNEVLGSIEYDEITFSPFAEPKEIVSIFGTFKAYGSAVMLHYFNDPLPFETGNTYYYCIDCNIINSETYISFYQYSGEYVTKGEDKREYTPVSNTLFKLRNYGSTVVKTFVKQ